FAAIEALAAHTWGLLLLTATPMQLDPDEYRALLTLLDPVTAPDAAAFRARVGVQRSAAAPPRGRAPRGGAPRPRLGAGRGALGLRPRCCARRPPPASRLLSRGIRPGSQRRAPLAAVAPHP